MGRFSALYYGERKCSARPRDRRIYVLSYICIKRPGFRTAAFSSPDKFQANIFLSGTDRNRAGFSFLALLCAVLGIIDKMDRKLSLSLSFLPFCRVPARGTPAAVDRSVEPSDSEGRSAAENPYFSGVFIDAASLKGDYEDRGPLMSPGVRSTCITRCIT